jgi:hypothetical protein
MNEIYQLVEKEGLKKIYKTLLQELRHKYLLRSRCDIFNDFEIDVDDLGVDVTCPNCKKEFNTVTSAYLHDHDVLIVLESFKSIIFKLSFLSKYKIKKSIKCIDYLSDILISNIERYIK